MDETIGFTVTLTDKVTGVARTVEASISGMTAKIVRSGEQIAKSQDKAASSLNRTRDSAKNASAAISRTLSAASLAAAEVGNRLSAVSSGIVDLFVSVGSASIKSAMETEQADARLAFSMSRIGKSLSEATKEIDDVALRTSLTRNEVSGLVDELAFQGVDALTKNLSDLSVTMADGMKKPITALEVLNDAVVFSGKNTKRIIFSLKEAISEQKIKPDKQLADDLQLTRKDLESWNAALKKASNSQEAFEALIRLTAERVGGVTASLGQTLYFATQQVDDWTNKINKEIFGQALPAITDFFAAINEMVIDLTNSDAFAGIRVSVTYIAEGFVLIGKTVLPVIRGALAMLSAFPAVLPALTALLTVIAGVSALAAAVATVSGIFFAIGGIAAILPTIIAGFKLMMVLMTGLAAAAVLVLAPIVAIGATLGMMFARFLGANSFLDFWERLKLVVSAVLEGIKNMRGELTFLSEGTAKKLEKAGLLQQVTELLGMVHRVTVGFDEFKTSIEESFGALANSGKAKLIENIMKTIGNDLGLSGMFNMSNTMEGAKSAGGSIAQFVAAFADGLMTATAMLGLFAAGIVRIVKLIDQYTPGTGLMDELASQQFTQAARAGGDVSSTVFEALSDYQKQNFIQRGYIPKMGADPTAPGFDAAEALLGEKLTSRHISTVVPGQEAWADELVALRARVLGSQEGNLNRPQGEIDTLARLSAIDRAKLDVIRKGSEQGVLDNRVYDRITKEMGPTIAKSLQGVVMRMKFDPNTPISTILEAQADLVMEGQ